MWSLENVLSNSVAARELKYNDTMAHICNSKRNLEYKDM